MQRFLLGIVFIILLFTSTWASAALNQKPKKQEKTMSQLSLSLNAVECAYEIRINDRRIQVNADAYPLTTQIPIGNEFLKKGMNKIKIIINPGKNKQIDEKLSLLTISILKDSKPIASIEFQKELKFIKKGDLKITTDEHGILGAEENFNLTDNYPQWAWMNSEKFSDQDKAQIVTEYEKIFQLAKESKADELLSILDLYFSEMSLALNTKKEELIKESGILEYTKKKLALYPLPTLQDKMIIEVSGDSRIGELLRQDFSRAITFVINEEDAAYIPLILIKKNGKLIVGY